MHVSRVLIKNFRSIKNLDITFAKGKNVIVGRNNSGKSNIIKALDIVLGENSPTWAKSENITEKDFYAWRETTADGIVEHSANQLLIWVELTREPNEDLNFEEINKARGFNILGHIKEWQDRKPIKEPQRFLKNDAVTRPEMVFELNEETQDKIWVDPKLTNQWSFKRVMSDKFAFTFVFSASKDDSGTVTQKDMKLLMRENDQTDWIFAFHSTIRNELLQSAIVPSFRDPQSQLRINNWTWYGKLMKHLVASQGVSQELNAAFNDVSKAANKIFENVQTEIAESSLSIAFPNTKLYFQFNADKPQDIHKNCIIYIDDGYKSELTQKGSGIQSATIIGLFQYYTQFVSVTGSALLCVEEPELYLHPHARRVISDRFDDFVGQAKNQVIFTTHSVEFLKPSSTDNNVILVRASNEGTKGSSIRVGVFKKLLINNNQNELFFADKVIVCEGYDEYLLRAVANEAFPGQLDAQNISLVAVGGKDQLAETCNLVVKLGINCFVFADFDFLLRDKSEERNAFGAKAHDSVIELGESFYSQPGIFGPKGRAAIGYLTKARNALRDENKKLFYTAKTKHEFAYTKLDMVLNTLRTHGVCILDGEVEHLSKQTDFIGPGEKKISLERIYELHAKLSCGEKIFDFFDCRPIQEFLKHVLDA